MSQTSFESAMISPPIHIIGACATMRSIMMITCWICVTSLVVRVIRVAVPARSNSRMLSAVALRNISSRRRLPKRMAMREERKLAAIVHAAPSSATSSIQSPFCRIYA